MNKDKITSQTVTERPLASSPINRTARVSKRPIRRNRFISFTCHPVVASKSLTHSAIRSRSECCQTFQNFSERHFLIRLSPPFTSFASSCKFQLSALSFRLSLDDHVFRLNILSGLDASGCSLTFAVLFGRATPIGTATVKADS